MSNKYQRLTLGFINPVAPDQVTYLLSFSHGGVFPVAWLEAAATFSSEAHTGVLAIQVTQASCPDEVQAAPCFLSPLPPQQNLGELSAMCVCDSNVYLGVNCTVAVELASRKRGRVDGSGIRRPELALVIHAKATPSTLPLPLSIPASPLCSGFTWIIP